MTSPMHKVCAVPEYFTLAQVEEVLETKANEPLANLAPAVTVYFASFTQKTPLTGLVDVKDMSTAYTGAAVTVTVVVDPVAEDEPVVLVLLEGVLLDVPLDVPPDVALDVPLDVAAPEPWKGLRPVLRDVVVRWALVGVALVDLVRVSG